MTDDVVYKYRGRGAYIIGIPARDLTAVDVSALDPSARDALEHDLAEGNVYRAVPPPEEEPPPAKARRTPGEVTPVGGE